MKQTRPSIAGVLTATLVMLIVATGCSSSSTLESGVGAQIAPSDTQAQIASKAAAALGECDLDADFLHPLSQLELIRDIQPVLSVRSYEPKANDLVLELGQDGAKQLRTFGNEPDETLLAIEWGLANFDELHVAEASTGRVALIVGELAGGRAAIVQPCSSHFVGGLFASAFGDDDGRRLLEFMTADSQGRASIVSDLAPRDEAVEQVVVLNPDDVSLDLLQSMTSAVVGISVQEARADRTICTRTESGWNDCILLDEEAVSPSVSFVDAFVDSSGVLEIYEMSGDANLRSPIRLLGALELSSAELDIEELGILIEVDLRSGSLAYFEVADLARGELNAERWAPLFANDDSSIGPADGLDPEKGSDPKVDD